MIDGQTWLNLGLVVLFVLIGGVFAATELALVSLRDSQLNALERAGGRGARVASIARDPNRFLSAVQIGVTVAGFFSAAYGGSTLAPDVAPYLERLGLSAEVASGLAIAVLTLLIAYLSLVLGELAPKRLALQRAVSVATLTGPPLDRFATVMRPVIWLLSRSSDGIVRLLGGDPDLTGEEVALVVGPMFHTAAMNQQFMPTFVKGGSNPDTAIIDPESLVRVAPHRRSGIDRARHAAVARVPRRHHDLSEPFGRRLKMLDREPTARSRFLNTGRSSASGSTSRSTGAPFSLKRITRRGCCRRGGASRRPSSSRGPPRRTA